MNTEPYEENCDFCSWGIHRNQAAIFHMNNSIALLQFQTTHVKLAVLQSQDRTMSPQIEHILQQIDLLSLVEQTRILRELEQKINPAHSNEPPASSAQQKWQQAIDTIRHQTPLDLEKQKACISDMFAQFNQDEDEADQQEAVKIISSIAKTSI
jgi:hypothetical protein